MGAPETGEWGKRGGGGWSTDFPRLVTQSLGSLLLAELDCVLCASLALRTSQPRISCSSFEVQDEISFALGLR